jgi:4a-hydroxytetrahydrobiopterin dehydratase
VQAISLCEHLDWRKLNLGVCVMKLTEDQIGERLARISQWARQGDLIIRNFRFENFKQAMQFVNRVAEEAETLNHHPDILIHGWNKVRLTLATHSVGGLTEKDFTLAERIDQL